PEHPADNGSGRNWDYRFCWVRDAYYVVQSLNRMGAADMLENYLVYLRNIVDQAGRGDMTAVRTGKHEDQPGLPGIGAKATAAPNKCGHVQPVCGVGLEPVLAEWIAPHLPGYRGVGPVRIGNQAHEHL